MSEQEVEIEIEKLQEWYGGDLSREEVEGIEEALSLEN